MIVAAPARSVTPRIMTGPAALMASTDGFVTTGPAPSGAAARMDIAGPAAPIPTPPTSIDPVPATKPGARVAVNDPTPAVSRTNAASPSHLQACYQERAKENLSSVVHRIFGGIRVPVRVLKKGRVNMPSSRRSANGVLPARPGTERISSKTAAKLHGVPAWIVRAWGPDSSSAPPFARGSVFPLRWPQIH